PRRRPFPARVGGRARPAPRRHPPEHRADGVGARARAMTASAYARWIDRRRRGVLAASALVAVAAGWLAARLPLRGDFAELLPEGSPSVRALRELAARVPSFGTILVVAESDDAALRTRAAEALAARLGRLDPALVATVTWDDRPARDYFWRNRFLFASLDDLRAARGALDRRTVRAQLDANPLDGDLEAPPRDHAR